MSRAKTYLGFVFCFTGAIGAAHKPSLGEGRAIAGKTAAAVVAEMSSPMPEIVSRSQARIAAASPVATVQVSAPRRLDLKGLTLSDFGDVDTSER